MFRFERNCQTVFQSGWTICIPISNAWALLILCILTSTGCCDILNFNHFDTWVVYPIAALICRSSWHDAECLHMLSCYLYIFFSEISPHIFPHSLKLDCLFFLLLSFRRFFYYYFRGKSFIRYVFCKYFFSICCS